MAIVLQTDFAWPDTSIERGVIEAAGHRFVAGPSTPLPAADIEELVAEHRPAAIMTCWAQVNAKAIAAAAGLRIVQRVGVGLDNIDVAAATANGAWVANIPDYCVPEVSDHAVALVLDWARGVTAFDRDVKAGSWNPAGAQLRRLADLTVGIVGYGRIGRATAAKLRAFGCHILVNTQTPQHGVECLSLDALLANCDVVILHAPLTADTHHLIGADRLSRMRPGAFLVNVSRGPLVDAEALLEAIASGHLSGAGLDVVEGEPAPLPALIWHPAVIVTPHIAFSSGASLAELRRRAAEEVVRVLAGCEPLNPCNNPESAL